MPVVEVAPAKTKGAVDLREPHGRPFSTSVLRCLILTTDRSRRDEFTESANASGWDAVSCRDVATVRDVVQRQEFQLAFIDMESVSEEVAAVYRDCCERLAVDSCVLLVICGRELDPLEEVWARKLGAWFYLPGVVGCEAILTLCGEARVVVEKQARQKKPDGAPHLTSW